jgi:acetyl-CoA acyltransferase
MAKVSASDRATESPSRDRPRRAVIVAGVRTPFVKAWTDLMEHSTLDLACTAVSGLLQQTGLDPKRIDGVVWGSVILPVRAPNTARELVLEMDLPRHIPGMTVTRACATGLQAITTAIEEVERGHSDVVLAGGSDSTSNAEMPMPQKLVHFGARLTYGGKKTPAQTLELAKDLLPLSDLIPEVPKLTERYTGRTMGEHCEEMAKIHGIPRDQQDKFAALSHQRAAKAIAADRFVKEVVPVQKRSGELVREGNIVRADTTQEKLARLRPVFDRDGSITAGNASPLTDGAAAVFVMEESVAKSLGLKAARMRSWAYAALDPNDGLLLGPAYASPIALERAGMTLKNIDLMDMHEAFAAQCLCNLKMMASDTFAKERLSRDKAMGEMDPARLNVHGGSIALGHPFGATGVRQATTMINELHEKNLQTAMITICAAGGMGVSAILERV